jgi:hypothetical protein
MHEYMYLFLLLCFNTISMILGEGIVDDSVWLIKSHYPERMGYLKFKVKRIILLIRNPFDALESYFHMGMTNTHDKHLSPNVSSSHSLYQLYI